MADSEEAMDAAALNADHCVTYNNADREIMLIHPILGNPVCGITTVLQYQRHKEDRNNRFVVTSGETTQSTRQQ